MVVCKNLYLNNGNKLVKHYCRRISRILMSYNLRLIRYLKLGSTSLMIFRLLYEFLITTVINFCSMYMVFSIIFLVYHVFLRSRIAGIMVSFESIVIENNRKYGRTKHVKSKVKNAKQSIINPNDRIIAPLNFNFEINISNRKYLNSYNLILMTDIVNSTYYMKNHSHGMRKSLRTHLQQVNSLLCVFDGYLVCVEGDSVICLFTNFQNSLNFINVLFRLSDKNFITHNESIQLRCVIHQGYLGVIKLANGISIFGDTIAEAYAICEKADSGVITISEYVYHKYFVHQKVIPRSRIRIVINKEQFSVDTLLNKNN